MFILPTTAPIKTFSPSAMRVVKTPACEATTSVVAFSVSTSKSGSLTFTVSPVFLYHLDKTPSDIDSPTDGTLISVIIRLLLKDQDYINSFNS